MAVLDAQGALRRTAAVSVLALVALGPALLSASSYSSAARILGAYPANGDVASGARQFYLQDQGGASKAEIYIDNAYIALMTPSIPPWEWEATVDTRGWASGYHVVRYHSYGGSGGDDVKSYSVLFDNDAPAISGAQAVYPQDLSAAKNLSTVRIVAAVDDGHTAVSLVRAEISGLNTSLLPPAYAQMFDDGLHGDGAAGDKVWGTDLVEVRAPSGFVSVDVLARDQQGNERSEVTVAQIDNHPPVVRRVNVLYPPGQSAAKLGDLVRVTALINDDSFTLASGAGGSPIDAAIFVDNSRFVSRAQWTSIENSVSALVDQMSSRSRVAIFASSVQGSGEEVKKFIDFVEMDASAIDPWDGFRGTGRAVVKHILQTDDGIHLTAPNGTPVAYRPAWDGIGEAASYAINNAQFGSTPAVLAVLAGDDYGVGGKQVGSEVFVPGAPQQVGSLFSSTWSTLPPSQGNVWGDPKDRIYDSVPRLVGYPPQAWEDVYVQNEPARTGLLGVPIPVMTFTFQLPPQSTDSAKPGYISPALLVSGAPANVSTQANAANFTVDYDLQRISATSTVGAHYFAQNGAELLIGLQDARLRLSQVAAKPIPLNLPRGISEFGANLSALGYVDPVGLYDDGLHQDSFAGDGIFGSELQAVGSKRSAREIVKVFAKDIAGTETSTQTLVSFDNDPPVASQVTVHYTGGKGTVQDGATTHVSARVADVGPVPDLEVRLLASAASPEVRLFDDGVGNDLVAGDGIHTSPTFTVPLGAPNGPNGIKVEARDAARNLGEAPGSIVVSNPPPSVVFFNPLEGGYIRGTSTLLVNVSDDRAYSPPDYSIDLKPWKPMGAVINNPWNYTGTIDASGMTEGPHNASVRATDSSGNYIESTIGFTLDLNDPVVAADFPRNGSRVSGNVTFRVYADDSIGVGLVLAQVLGQVFVLAKNAQSGFWEASLDTRRFADGGYDYSIAAFDLSGRFTVVSMRIWVDNSPPRIELVNPRPNSVVGGVVTVQANVDDLGPLVTTYSVGPVAASNISEPWNTTRMEDGEYGFSVTARDAAGHASSVNVDVRVDNSAPVIIPLKVPVETDRLRGDVLVRVKAEDAALEIVSMSLVAGPATYLVCSDFRELFECGFNSSVFPDSNYTMLFEARDIVGHTTFLGRNVTIDNGAPEMTIAPGGHRVISGDVKVDIEARDISRPLIVEVRVDGGEWGRLAESTPVNHYIFVWRTDAMENGQHLLEVRATDDAGNSATERLRYVVENFRTAPIYFFILLVVGLILFAYGFTRREDVEEVEYFEERGPQYIVVPQPVPQPFIVQVPVPSDDGGEEAGDAPRRSAAQRAAERRTEGGGGTGAGAAAPAGEAPTAGTRTEQVAQRRRMTLEERRDSLRGRVEGRR
jgi:hypothetical protein